MHKNVRLADVPECKVSIFYLFMLYVSLERAVAVKNTIMSAAMLECVHTVTLLLSNYIPEVPSNPAEIFILHVVSVNLDT